MSDVTISYKGADIATMDASGTKTLQTQGKYCEGDISVAYVKPSGGDTVAEFNDVIFIDYDGTIRYSYTSSDFLQLSELPPNPTHNGLIAQGWNWTLADAKAYVTKYGALNIGQVYDTDNNDTRIRIIIGDSDVKTFTFWFNQNAANAAEIDFGDGTATYKTSETGQKLSVTHTYASTGDYVISFKHLIANAACVGAWYGYQGGFFGTTPESRCVREIYISSKIRKWDDGIWNAILPNLAAYLEVFTIPSNITTIGQNTLQRCGNIKALILPKGFQYTGAYSLSSSLFALVSFSKDVTNISSLNSSGRVCIPEGWTGNSTTLDGSLVSELVCPQQSIPYRFARYSRQMIRLLIGESVTAIAGDAFAGASSLYEIHFLGTTPPTVANSNAFIDLPSKCVIKVPTGSLASYTTATNYPSPSTYTYMEV